MERPGVVISLQPSPPKIPSGCVTPPYPLVHTDQWNRGPAVLHVDLG